MLTECFHLYETLGKANLTDRNRKHMCHGAEHVRGDWEGLMARIHMSIMVVLHGCITL